MLFPYSVGVRVKAFGHTCARRDFGIALLPMIGLSRISKSTRDVNAGSWSNHGPSPGRSYTFQSLVGI
jgi:hypothetical protein